MNRCYRFLGLALVCLFTALFGLQAATGLFLNNHAITFTSRSQLPIKQQITPTPVTIITGGAGGVGYRAGGCVSGLTSTPTDFLKLLAPGWTVNDLSPQYRNGNPVLCYDNFKNEWAVPGGTWVKITDFLSVMGWPSDLFLPSAGGQILIVARPGDTLQPAQPTQQNNNNGQQSCSWTPDLGIIQPTINICDFASVILKAILLTPLRAAVNAMVGDAGNSFMWTTPAKDTYQNPNLSLYWNTSLYVVNALLVVSIAWGALRYIVSKNVGSWLSYADLLELVPRLIMALIAAYLSARICQIAIDGSNALSSIFSSDILSSLNNDPKDLFTTFTQIFLCLLVLILILEEAIRLAILLVLVGFSPIWAFSGALRETQFIFKGGLKLLFFVALLQPCQIAVMSLGQHLTKSIGGNSGSPLYYLVSIALMLLVLYMFGWFLRAGGISFGAGGVFGAMMGARMLGGITRASGRGVAAAGRGYFKGSIFDKSRASGGSSSGGSSSSTGGGSNRGGGGGTATTASSNGPNRGGGGGTATTANSNGPNNTAGGGSTNNRGAGPNAGHTGRRKKLPAYDPYKKVIQNSRSAKTLQRAHTQTRRVTRNVGTKP